MFKMFTYTSIEPQKTNRLPILMNPSTRNYSENTILCNGNADGIFLSQ